MRATSPSMHDSSFGAQGDNEQMPMNAVSKHPKLKLRLLLASNVFEAGGTVSGHLELTSSTSQRLRIGEIAVELEAFEGALGWSSSSSSKPRAATDAILPELSSRDHSATQIFLFNRTLFQGEHLPPSNAVLPSAPTAGYWTARKGRTTFPFSFRLPDSAPSCVTFAGNACLRYALKATTQTWWNDQKTLVTVKSDAFVVEKWEDEGDERYMQPVEAVADTRLFMGGTGAVWLEAGVAEQLFVAGGMVMIRAGVKNNTKRHLSGLKVAIARRLIFPVSGPPGVPAQRPSLEPQITEVVHTQHFKGPSFEFPPSEEVVVNLAVDLPRDVRTIRKTRLFEVQTVAIISAQMGNFAKDLTVEVPFYVAHSSSVQRPAEGSLAPLHNLPRRSTSAMAHRDHLQHHPHHQHHHHPQNHAPHHQYQQQLDPQMRTVEAYGAERGWSPAPIPQQGFAPPSRPASAAMGMVALPGAQQQPLAIDAAVQQLIWDPNAQNWTTSMFLNNLSPPQQPDSRPLSAQQQAQLPRPASAQGLVGNRAPAHVAQDAYGGQPWRGPQSGSAHLLQATARRSSAPVPVEHQQQPRNSYLAPGPEARPLPAPTSPQQPSEPLQSLSPSAGNKPQVQAPAPAPSPSQLLAMHSPPQAGLATIEEDSESQAGTVRSIRALGGGSVSRGDILQFEEMASKAEDEEEMREAMRRMGMVPEEEKAVKDDDKSLPRPPVPSTKESSSQMARKPRASDIFAKDAPGPFPVKQETARRASMTAVDSAPATKASAEPMPEPRTPRAESTPLRPSSSQGHGLKALESRLASPDAKETLPANAAGSRRNSDVAVMANVRRSSETRSRNDSGALRAAAAAAAMREKRAKEDEEERRKDEERRKEEVQRKKAREAELERLKREEEARDKERDERRRKREERENQEALERESRREQERKRSTGITPAPLSDKAHSLSSSQQKKEVEGDGKPKRAHDQKEEEVRQLNKQAVNRVAGWLEKTPSPNSSRTDTAKGESELQAPASTFDPTLSPKTPSPSVLMAGKDEDEFPFPASASAAARKSPSAHRKSSLANEPTPSLSADLRALIDSSEVRPTPKPGTALKSHVSTRRFSNGAVPASENQGGGTTTPAASLSRARRISLPAQASSSRVPSFTKKANEGVPSAAARGIPGHSTFDKANVAFLNKAAPAKVEAQPLQPSAENVKADDGAEDEEEKVKGIPLSVQKHLLSSPSSSKEGGAKYEARSARGGRGGKVASVASMWANISDGAAKDEATPLSTVKPKARRSGASPALDFSSPEKSSSTPAKADEEVKPSQPQQRYKSPALKTTSAPHFINTTLPKAVITSPKSPTTLEEPLRAHPQPKPAHGPNGTRIVSAPEAASVAAAAKEGALKPSRKITADLMAAEARLSAGVVPEDFPKDVDPSMIKMAGRGTTKPIGKEKLADLRSLWGG